MAFTDDIYGMVLDSMFPSMRQQQQQSQALDMLRNLYGGQALPGQGAAGGFGAGGGMAAGPGVYKALDAGTLPTDFSGAGDIGAAGGIPGVGGVSPGQAMKAMGAIQDILGGASTAAKQGAGAAASSQREGFNTLLNTALSAYTGGLYSADTSQFAAKHQARKQAGQGMPQALPQVGPLFRPSTAQMPYQQLFEGA